MSREKRNLELIMNEDYDTLIKENENLIYHILKRMKYDYNDKDDLVNIGRLSIYNAAIKYEIPPKNNASFGTYLAASIYKNILSYLRSNKKKLDLVYYEEITNEDGEMRRFDGISIDRRIGDPYRLYLSSQLEKVLDTVKLSDKEKMVFDLYCAGKSHKEIKGELSLDINKNSVGTMLFRVRKKVQKALILNGLDPAYLEEGYKYE